jgi:hypothetical protein
VKKSKTLYQKTLKGKEGFNYVFITAEDAEGRGKKLYAKRLCAEKSVKF